MKLLGSHSHLDGLIEGISRFFGGSAITLTSVSDREWKVCNADGPIEGVRVIQKGKRFRFEMEAV